LLKSLERLMYSEFICVMKIGHIKKNTFLYTKIDTISMIQLVVFQN